MPAANSARDIDKRDPMPSNRLATVALAVLGAILLVIGIVYFAEPAKSLPGFFPGHEAGSTHHHVKHGIAAVLLGLGAFVLAWFQTGPRSRAEA
jgi:uncharacterized membrane protein